MNADPQPYLEPTAYRYSAGYLAIISGGYDAEYKQAGLSRRIPNSYTNVYTTEMFPPVILPLSSRMMNTTSCSSSPRPSVDP